MTSAAAAAGTRSTGPPPSFRADIQGLRAVAVLLVVVDHTFGWPTGGFVGVDVFYVISGFLITGLLMRELDQTGSISMRGFYARRAKRILPAALVVLAVTVVAAFALWFLPRALQTLLDALSAAVFVSNWHFVATATDYLQAAGATSPVQHFWSLSIEEQFYALWPLALLVLFHLVRRSRRGLIGLVLLAIACSLAWAAYRTGQKPTAAYFDTGARAWELFAGAAIALVGTARAGVPEPVRRLVSSGGLALIIGSAVIVKTDWAVPFPWVVPAVAGSAAVIWAAARTGTRSALGNPVAQWLGDISYSLYLWHFPVLIFAASLFGDSWAVALACVPVMLVFSELSRRYVERPFLHSPVLRRATKAQNTRPFVAKDVVLGVVVAGCIGVFALSQLRGPAAISSADEAAAGMMSIPHAVSDPDRDARRDQQISASMSAGSWQPRAAAQLETLYTSQQGPAMLTSPPGCRNDVFRTGPPLVCGEDESRGDASDVVVAGDSIALSWVPTVQQLAARRDWRLHSVGYSNCSLFDVRGTSRASGPGFADACAASREKMFDLIEDTSPEVVFLSAAEAALDHTGLSPEAAAAEWQAGVARTLERLRDVPAVVILSNPPVAKDPGECATRVTAPGACISTVSSDYLAKAHAEREAAEAFPNTQFIDTSEWFCADDGRCPAVVGGQVLRTDVAHLTEAAAADAAPLLEEAMQAPPDPAPLEQLPADLASR